MHEIIMGYQGEMSLKGLNRNQFESAMMKILRYRLKTVGKFKVYCTQSTFYMEPEEEDVDMDLAFDRVSKVFGLAALSRAVVCDKDFDTICQTAEDYLGGSLLGTAAGWAWSHGGWPGVLAALLACAGLVIGIALRLRRLAGD